MQPIAAGGSMLDDLGSRAALLLSEAGHGALVCLLAIAVLAFGWALARLLGAVTLALLRFLRFNQGVRGLLGTAFGIDGPEPAKIASLTVFWAVLGLAAVLGADALGLGLGTSVAERLRDVLPRVVAAAIELVAGIALAMGLGEFTRRLFEGAGAKHGLLRGQVVAGVLGGFAVLVALEQLGLAAEFIVALGITATATLGLGLALAFGLGCRDLARDFVVEYLRSLDERPSTPPAGEPR
jgi:hypothetical protein